MSVTRSMATKIVEDGTYTAEIYKDRKDALRLKAAYDEL